MYFIACILILVLPIYNDVLAHTQYFLEPCETISMVCILLCKFHVLV